MLVHQAFAVMKILLRDVNVLSVQAWPGIGPVTLSTELLLLLYQRQLATIAIEHTRVLLADVETWTRC